MESRLIQGIICKCGAQFAACREPECYTEKEWQEDLRKYVKEGCTVKMFTTGEFKFEGCTCNPPEIDKNQTTLVL